MSSPPDPGLRAQRRAAERGRHQRQRRLAAAGLMSVFVLIVAAAVLLSRPRRHHDDHGASSGSSVVAARPPAGRRPGSAPAAKVPGSAPGAHRAAAEAVPILMYHLVNAPPAGTALPELWVSREHFAAQVGYLAQHGFHVVTLQQVWDAWHHGGLLPGRPIVLSFDDGYHSQYSNALPILAAHHWPGVLNLQINQTREDLKPADVRAMLAAGWELDVHTFSHPDLTTLGADRLHHEVDDARARIKREFGVPANFFCYPAGRYDPAVEAAVKRAGFLGATTTVDGRAAPDQPPAELERIRINGSDDLSAFAQKLGGSGGGRATGE